MRSRATSIISVALILLLLAVPTIYETVTDSDFLDISQPEQQKQRFPHGTRAVPDHWSNKSGDWHDVTTWWPEGIPEAGDIININLTHEITATQDLACFRIDLYGNLTIDAITGEKDLYLNFTDNSANGFNVSTGYIYTIGNSEYNVTVQNADYEGTINFYTDLDANYYWTANYTTFRGHVVFAPGWMSINNCTFYKYSSHGIQCWSKTIALFNDNYIDHAGNTNYAMSFSSGTVADMNNITIVNTDSGIALGGAINPPVIEFINSTFDESRIAYASNRGQFISKDHNKTANRYLVMMGPIATLIKTNIDYDITIDDNVEIVQGGTFQCNENLIHSNLTISNLAVLQIDNGKTHTIKNNCTLKLNPGTRYDITGGSGANIIIVQSDSIGNAWFLNASESKNVSVMYVNVSDSDASLGSVIYADDTCINYSNNINWHWGNITDVNLNNGTVDYDPQVFVNSQGHLVAVYGYGDTNSTVFAQYSKDNGTTWSSPTHLFTNNTIGDGIISNWIGGMWEYSGQVYNDVLYLTSHLWQVSTYARSGLTICNISDVANIEDYQNWKSVNGNSANSSGGGENHWGFDLLFGPTSYTDPTIAVQGPNKILVICLLLPPGNNKLYVDYWNGITWSGGAEIKGFDYTVEAVPIVRYTRQGDWVLCALLDESTGGGDDFVIAMKCNSSDDPSINASWKGFNGLDDFDYVLDRGDDAEHGSMQWPNMEVDANNNVHVVTGGDFGRTETNTYDALWHNYWNYTLGEWVNGETQNQAGDIVLVHTSHPRLQNVQDRYTEINADGGGNIIAVIHTAQFVAGNGIYSLMWNGTQANWTNESYTRQGGLTYSVVGQGYMNGNQTKSYFLLTPNTGNEVKLLTVSYAESGSPFWENYTLESEETQNMTLVDKYGNPLETFTFNDTVNNSVSVNSTAYFTIINSSSYWWLFSNLTYQTYQINSSLNIKIYVFGNISDLENFTGIIAEGTADEYGNITIEGLDPETEYWVLAEIIEIPPDLINGEYTGTITTENGTFNMSVGIHNLYDIILYEDYWNFKGYPAPGTISSSALYNLIPNCTAIVSKNIITEYWYTYWPNLGMYESWDISYGDGVFILVEINVTWQVENYIQNTDIVVSKWNCQVYTNITIRIIDEVFGNITNCTSLVWKNDTSNYWYTYWPGLGLSEIEYLEFGDGIFILTDQDTSWDHT